MSEPQPTRDAATILREFTADCVAYHRELGVPDKPGRDIGDYDRRPVRLRNRRPGTGGDGFLPASVK